MKRNSPPVSLLPLVGSLLFAFSLLFPGFAAEEEKKNASPSQAARPAPAAPAPKTKKKLTWKEERELEGMESAIEEAEKKVAGYETLFSSPDFFSAHGADAPKLKEEFEEAQKRVACLYARWEELEKKAAADN